MIFKMIFLALSFICCLSLSSAQLIRPGQCVANIETQDNFTATEFLGQWFVNRRTENPTFRADCATIEFTEGNVTNLNIRGVNQNFLEEASGNAVHQSGSATYTVTVNSQTTNFSIIMTDYSNYAIGYSCENEGNQSNVYLWVLGRASTVPTEMMEALMNQTLFRLFDITLNDLTTIDHSELACTTIPEIPSGQPVILPGQCDEDMPVVQNFDVPAFVGTWNLIASYYTVNQLGTCNRAQYSLLDGIVAVTNSEVVNQTLSTISGSATLASNDSSARLLVTLEVQPGVTVPSPLWILATDYANYAISYTCVNIENNQRRVNSWILSRTKQLNEQAQTAVDNVIRSNLDLNNRFFIQSDHSDDACFYYPEPAPNTPVVFRGQCDPNIPAMASFDAARYLGLWHNIESYPSTFQPGTCNNALYEASGDVVNVYNTQVINQTLDTIRGVASVVSTDGSAKLSVVFPDLTNTSLTVETDYWVLDTDYETYSLVYSCQNINDDERLVFSWKLSRTKEMPNNATTAIDNIIANITVLDQRYFEVNDQSREGCFYYPDPQPGVPVRFPGQCDNTIRVTTNFSLNQFAGTWYEIEAYPKEQQPGQCVSHEFTVNGGNFSLVTSGVSDQFLSVTNSVASLDSNDGSARMTITIRSGNTDITIPYWILDTDYENYALAYSCVNDGNDFQMIYSWKLSRTRQLSLQSSTQINNTMSEVTVLDQRYYDDVDQSPSACFFLPEIPPGQPIILNGQCDPNITVVENFRAADYLGNWRLIESYASEFQNGTCIEATYNLLSNGTVEVVNTQVIDQTLRTEIGSAVLGSDDGRGILRVTFPSASTEIEYWILDTDYSSYALVYSCVNVDAERRRVWSWKLSRTRNLTPTAIDNMNRVINGIEVLNNRYYQLLDQSDTGCFYFPTPEPNRPVVFRGQCDPNINVVNDFNAAAYLGLWYSIQSYPSEFQPGTCNNALYTLRGDVVDVYNTQVINETLDTIHGEARLSEAANVAKLNVTFPVVGTNLTIETPYWVLATDYYNYSLVYTCVNVDEEHQRVWSWKLSRTKQLTPDAVTAINNVVNTIPVLNDQYYYNNDQSVQGCFYYPEPEPGLPVVFPGQCDQNIQAVPNFNLNSFAGTWYEIEAYPKDQQTGQCVNHTYTAGSANTLNLVSSSVTAQNLNTTNSVVRFDSPQDTSGKLVISLTGTDIDIPFWVLETNYDDFALAYSCVNINATFRSVYSWKLSRNQTLSPAANTAINTRIDQIDVLNNTYYEDIDQSDNACFYLPEATDEPVEFVGQCDETISVVQNFNISAYMGRWRMIQSYPQPSQTGTCNQANYNINSQGLVDVFNTQVLNQQLATVSGSAAPATDDGSAKFLVTFPNSTEPAPYWVLDTDYDSFALVYSCRNLPNNRRRVTSWKLSRTPELTPNATQRINEIVNSINVLNDRFFSSINQTDQACFYLPTPDPTRPVTFRGQCDENIPVVETFDPAAYLGLWYNIQSYPSEFQPGTCNNAFYSLRDGVVDVYNTQVINETLDTIHGIARLTGPANIAKLEVTFPVVGTNMTVDTPYWVLATDYYNYSLVYTCVNVDDEHQRVWSWKLSRTKQLTPDAETAINNVVNTIPVLNDQYYYNNDQSVQGCFYYPEPEPGLPVVFPGQCDQNIQAVPNFNLSSFAGTWYEIEAYPKDQQTGQCVNHTYTAGSANTLNLVSSSVTAQNLNTTNSVVRFDSPQDTSGKLVISLTGTDIDIPFWVLETNYDDFALAYSCVNINATFRSVYSWKLSRNQTLSPAANTAINTRIDQIDVLNNTYYEDIDQSDNACFYLPEATDEPVEFVGQCDETISVVQNFNISAYMGRWRMIQSYPQPSQTGTCNQANYNINSQGLVDVFNTQVLNQQLATVSGSAAPATDDGSAKFLVTFPNSTEPAPYWVLDTDYDSFALVYSCRNLPNNRRRVTSWKLSRTPELTPNATQRINEIVNSINVLNDRFFSSINQTDQACFYLPTPDPTRPVTFRGQCDENIPVVETFDPAAYLGLWYNIQSYPSEFQPGTCNNAFYSLRDGVVDVYNTQVINETLDTIHGIARLTGPANIAKLEVTFPVVGTNMTVDTPYWVLATDYYNYSLVYTCVNVDDEHQRVWSWKLSRTKQLTPDAETAINNVVNTIPVLNDQYYYNNDQSVQGCFYYPEPEPGLPVVFPGQCDQNIQAVPNFNLNSFAGTWYEIEAYPKDQQTGQCVNHAYTAGSANTLNLVSSSVTAQNLNTTNSVVRFDSPQDTSGKLVISFTGTDIDIPFWVLETNYDDFALAYSCVNINATFRSVYSWKLSRNQTLSPAANTAINTRIDQIDVLNNTYYEDIDQSDNACFYLPEATDEPVEFVGQCDETIPVVQNFNISAYMGRWRMIQSYPQPSQTGTCNQANYNINSQGLVDVFNTQVLNQQLATVSGSAAPATDDGSAKFLVTFPNSTEPAPYWVLDTDYDSFALVYSCRNLPNNRRRVTSWKLSRTPELTPNATQRINEIVNSINVLNDRFFSSINQTDQACFYLPTPDPTRPVTFRGQCDENIPVVETFDPAAYLGLWYNIQSYPSEFQPGTCNNAFYSLRDGVVDVYNTQVINETLDTIHGLARLTGPANIAKLEVTFPVVGTNMTVDTPYWVLATDYYNYSLVYTCVNVDDEHQRVWSWKLSRTKQLTPDAETAINNVVNTIPVLNDQYYYNNDQSVQGCFYYPEPEPGLPVVFPGQCDQNIQAVPNFNLSSFAGTWYEIQAYPKDQQTGQCINHAYTAGSANTLNLVSSSVTAQNLSTTNSVVRFNSTQDSSGKLVISLTGTDIDIPFWVLETNYDDFALAYSCVNINETFRSVYSWKLSRTQTLSPAANTAINTRIDQIDVLNNTYYEDIDQSDEACFYLPNLNPGEPVIFNGQCDPNIPVVQNFRPQDYTGRWRMIETYAAEFQGLESTCNDASYTLNSNGIVDVYNTQVINQTLDTINGTATLATTDGSAKLLVNFPTSPEPADYWILDTDYTSFALVYSCRNISTQQRRVWTWKLSRTRELTAAANTRINQVISGIDVLNQRYYTNVDHSDDACFYYPVADGNPLVFRGQCDENIPVVTNFNAQAYLGIWYDIESYPVRFQDGTCPTATYTASTTGVDVFNTQVVGQQLDTIEGSAVLATDDGQAKLNVSFPVAGTNLTTNSPYWVLATDYENYALVYSCVNIDDEYRRVSSWKLSRERSLSQASVAAINNVTNSIDVLRQDYYVTRGHNETDCFYYPDNNGGPVIQAGQCNFDNLDVVTNFNASLFSGPWYEASRFPSELQEGECVSNEFVAASQNLNMTMTIVSGESQSIFSGSATLQSSNQGILDVNLVNSNGETFQTRFYVLGVDYNDYALLYNCREINNTSQKQVYSWKLSRSQSGLSSTAVNAINNIVSNTEDLFEGYYDNTDQTVNGCFHYPEFEELPPAIELLGPCDESITAIPNFNVTGYLGRWYEIASYPQAFQEGTCARAEYMLGTDVVNVFNSQVVNRTLDVQTATAVVASTDGSGLLEVTFQLSNGVTNVVNYYVLETDYNTFALVYSCRNLPNGDRQVTSWQLSRTPTMPAAAVPIINDIINNTQGLRQDYYQPTNQSSEACFYIPNVNRDEAPRFRGQCENIQGVQGFDIERFVGWWHEIESYPSDYDRGTCYSSEVIQNGNDYIMVDTGVFGTRAEVNTSTLVADSNGRLTKTGINGQTTDVWVLDTDYETYALLYTCENISDEYRRVWSAKYSKTRQLSEAAQTAMSSVIQATETLESQFYLPANQSDAACFHYPEQTGNRIILPGQCDTNIPVVQNFNPAEYSGTWYQIQRYPQTHENGTCVGARYTLDESTGVVTVLNWQVTNGVLDTVEGTATVNSTDGSAKLLVNLPIRNTDDPNPTMVSMELYVLTTDYTSYALAYSCVNIGPYQRAVGAWKLSRTRSLPTGGNNAINEYMNTREELFQDYFQNVEQNDDCEEPSSAVLFRSSIIILLICSVLHRLL